MAVKVKICGITSLVDAQAALDLGADAIGLNFYSGSRRVVSPEQAKGIACGLSGSACVVGVFVNAPRDHIAAVVREVGLSALQFHGNEPPDACLGWGELILIKALPADTPDVAACAARYPTAYILVDTPSMGYGGGGETFDWCRAAPVPRQRLLLAGGLTPDNVADAVRTLRPAGVDVASGVEDSPGRKNHEKLQAFIDAAKAA